MELQAIYKKKLGTVRIDEGSISWKGGEDTVQVPWDQVEEHQVSPAAHPRALLRLQRRPRLPGTRAPPLVLEFPPSSSSPSGPGAAAAAAGGGRAALEACRARISEILRAKKAPAAAPPTKGKAKATEKKAAGEEESKPKAAWGNKPNNPVRNHVPGQSLQSSGAGHHRAGARAAGAGGQGGGAAAAAAEQRAAALAADPGLRAQHRELVGGGVVAEADFWAARQKQMADEQASVNAQTTGIPSTLNLFQTEHITSRHKKFVLTARMIRHIFLMYPAVERCYKAKVPEEMSEKEFWVKYFQSQFFLRDSGAETPDEKNSHGQDDMFTRFEAEEIENEKKKQSRKSAAPHSNGNTAKKQKLDVEVDPSIDLTATENDYHPPSTDKLFPTGDPNSKGAKVIDKFNRHAKLVLDPPSSDISNKQRKHYDKAKIFGEGTELLELRKEEPPAYDPLNLKNKEQYFGGDNEEAAAGGGGGGGGAPTHQFKMMEKEKKQRLDLRRPFAALRDPAATLLRLAERADRDHSAEARFGGGGGGGLGGGGGGAAYDDDMVPPEFEAELRASFLEVTEALRHFYAALPRRGPAARAKAARVAAHLETKYEGLKAWRARLLAGDDGAAAAAGGPASSNGGGGGSYGGGGGHGNARALLVKPLMDQLDHAFEAHERAQRAHAAAATAGGGGGGGGGGAAAAGAGGGGAVAVA